MLGTDAPGGEVKLVDWLRFLYTWYTEKGPSKPQWLRQHLHDCGWLLALLMEAFGDLVAACEQALALDPQNEPARGLLANAYWARHQQAEQDGDAAGMAAEVRRCERRSTSPISPVVGLRGRKQRATNIATR